MRIYHYLKHFPPRGDHLNEGTSKAVDGLAASLAACGAPVTVLCEGAEAGAFQAAAGYQIRCFVTSRRQPAFTLSAGLARYLRDRHLHASEARSLVVLHGIFHPSLYSMSRLLRTLAVPYVVAPHDPYHRALFTRRAYLKWPYWYLFEKRVLTGATAVQILDRRHDQFLRDLGVRTPVIEVPNGFSPADVLPESSLTWTTAGPARFGFLGRLDAFNKGLDILLDAFAPLAQSADAHLVIRGPDGGDGKVLRARAARLATGGRATVLGPDYQRPPSAIVAEYDVYCLPSRFEGFGLAALEAMLAARPILISEVAGLAPHVRACDCGLVVRAELSAVRAGLSELLRRRGEWKQMGLRGRRYALEHLNWPRIGAAALADYRKLVS